GTSQIIAVNAQNEHGALRQLLQVPALPGHADELIGRGSLGSSRTHLLLSPASCLVKFVRLDGKRNADCRHGYRSLRHTSYSQDRTRGRWDPEIFTRSLDSPRERVTRARPT